MVTMERWNEIIVQAIIAGGYGLPIEFWRSMLILGAYPK